MNNLYEYRHNDVLSHHGILGMKWGVRRYQNPDGSLTNAGKRRYQNRDGSLNEEGQKLISDQYRKNIAKGNEYTTSMDSYITVNNRTADRFNGENGALAKYNDDYDRKLGDKAKDHDYENDTEYENGVYALWDTMFDEELTKFIAEAYDSNENYKRAMSLYEMYSMETFDTFARDNAKGIEEIRKKISGF